MAQNPAPAAPTDGRPTLQLPFPGGTTYRVTCGYGCYQHRGTMSYAVDFAVPANAPIVAAAAGTVAAVTWETGLPANLHLGDALIVYIDHGGGWKTRYVHLSGITVRAGDEVAAGQIIGYGGATGASAAHLHFELKRGDSLHSLSYTIDELFDGKPPEAGSRYTSQNYAAEAVPTPAPAATVVAQTSALAVVPVATATVAPTPAPIAIGGLALSRPLTVTPALIAAGEQVTTTFTVRNETAAPVTYALLGVGGRSADGQLQARTLFFQRNVRIEAGESYLFTGTRALDLEGELLLFPFAVEANGTLLWLVPRDDVRGAGAGEVQLTVRAAPHTLYLPLLRRTASGSTTTRRAAPTPAPTP